MKPIPWWFTSKGHDEEHAIFLKVWNTVKDAFSFSDYRHAPVIAEQVYMEYLREVYK